MLDGEPPAHVVAIELARDLLFLLARRRCQTLRVFGSHESVNVVANRLLSVRNSENQQQLQGQMIMTVPIHDRRGWLAAARRWWRTARSGSD